MISTQALNLPSKQKLQSICKAISVLDAILSQEWEYRYYSYNNKWGNNEEFFEMRDGSGDQMLILFKPDGCVINGFAHEFYDFEEQLPSKDLLTKGLPVTYHEFIFGEPVQSIGTTFCIWTDDENQWKTAELEHYEDGSADLLDVFDENPQSYVNWATEYFEGSYVETGIPIETVTKIYNGEMLTKEMVLSIVDDLDDWQQLKTDLNEIGYPYNFI